MTVLAALALIVIGALITRASFKAGKAAGLCEAAVLARAVVLGIEPEEEE